VARFLLRRLTASLLLLVLVATGIFFLLHAAPGDPTELFEGQRINREQREHLRHLYGLDRPLSEQYLRWLATLARGELGLSLSQQRPVTTILAEALPATLLLATGAILVEFGAALLLGIAAARRRGGIADQMIRAGSLIFYSQPPFWIALMLVLLFASVWPVLPASHMRSVDAAAMSPAGRTWDLLKHLLLPSLSLGLYNAGATLRFVRGSLLEVMGMDYIRAARARGLSERRVVWVHGLRNALTPLIQLFSLTFPALLNGALLTEIVFAWPGIGRVTYQAVLSRDYPLILGLTLFSAFVVVLGNLAADLAQAAADPRVRHA